MSKSPTSFLRSLRPGGKDTPAAPSAAGPTPTALVESVFLPASPFHPALSLFSKQKHAQERADALGKPWGAFTFACGFLVTDGWHFQDTQGPLTTFCPVPHECLETIQDIVTDLQKSELDGKYYPIHVAQALRDHPVLAALPPAYFDSVCLCTIMRIAHPPYSAQKDDWLTIPAWALRIPKRRMRIK